MVGHHGKGRPNLRSEIRDRSERRQLSSLKSHLWV